jgi:hypothetical protein
MRLTITGTFIVVLGIELGQNAIANGYMLPRLETKSKQIDIGFTQNSTELAS